MNTSYNLRIVGLILLVILSCKKRVNEKQIVDKRSQITELRYYTIEELPIDSIFVDTLIYTTQNDSIIGFVHKSRSAKVDSMVKRYASATKAKYTLDSNSYLAIDTQYVTQINNLTKKITKYRLFYSVLSNKEVVGLVEYIGLYIPEIGTIYLNNLDGRSVVLDSIQTYMDTLIRKESYAWLRKFLDTAVYYNP